MPEEGQGTAAVPAALCEQAAGWQVPHFDGVLCTTPLLLWQCLRPKGRLTHLTTKEYDHKARKDMITIQQFAQAG